MFVETMYSGNTKLLNYVATDITCFLANNAFGKLKPLVHFLLYLLVQTEHRPYKKTVGICTEQKKCVLSLLLDTSLQKAIKYGH